MKLNIKYKYFVDPAACFRDPENIQQKTNKKQTQNKTGYRTWIFGPGTQTFRYPRVGYLGKLLFTHKIEYYFNSNIPVTYRKAILCLNPMYTVN